MPRAVIAYDKDLPEILDRRPWERPLSFLVKDESAPTGWREDRSGRRPSKMLMVSKMRSAVDAWREGDPKRGQCEPTLELGKSPSDLFRILV